MTTFFSITTFLVETISGAEVVSTKNTFIVIASFSVIVCHKLSDITISIGNLFFSLGAFKFPVYIQSSVSDKLIIQSLNNNFTDFNSLLANTFISILVPPSTLQLSERGERIIFLNLGLLLSILIITFLDSQIILSSASRVNACNTFFQVNNHSISFSKIQSELEVVLNSSLLFSLIFT
jgi:hypothetical protein